MVKMNKPFQFVYLFFGCFLLFILFLFHCNSVQALKIKQQSHEDLDDESLSINIQESEYHQKIKNISFKAKCKYRKSCYENPEAFIFKNVKETSNSKTNAEDIVISEDSDDKEKAKLKCKYRYSCYEEKGLKNFLKDEKNKKHTPSTILTSKPSSIRPPSDEIEEPLTVQEIAEIVVEDLKEHEKKLYENPPPKHSHAEEQLLNMQEKLKKKLDCKYRISCYNTGKLPTIERSKVNIWLDNLDEYVNKTTDKIAIKKVEKKFDELDDREMKVYCKYRPSCYKSGIQPKIGAEQKFKYVEIIENIKETKEKSLQERCKYRKSCYKTGVLPKDLNPVSKQKNIQDVLKPVPTTLEELKLYCKYRKSCYLRQAENKNVDGQINKNDEVSTVKNNDEEEKIHLTNIEKNIIQSPKEEQEVQPILKIKKEIKAIPKKAIKKVKKAINKIPKVVHKTIELIKPDESISDQSDLTEESIKDNNLESLDVPSTNETRKSKVKSPISVLHKSSNAEKSTKKEKKQKVEKNIEESSEIPKIVKEEKIQEILTNPELNLHERLKCKYRKSCYKSEGLKDIIKLPLHTDPTHSILSKHSVIIASPDPAKEWEKRKRDEMLKCKYRKSCYPTIDITNDGKNEIKNSAKIVEESTHTIKHNPGPTADEMKDNLPLEHIPTKLKLFCKYRFSCYKNIDIQNLLIHTETTKPHVPMPTQNLDRHCTGACAKYYLSCREQLGLPPKERAPIGPNGKKLCRKKEK